MIYSTMLKIDFHSINNVGGNPNGGVKSCKVHVQCAFYE